jgi:hypothetical protein
MIAMLKTVTSNQLLGEIGEAAVRLRFLNMGFQFDGRSRLEAGIDGIAEVMDTCELIGSLPLIHGTDFPLVPGNKTASGPCSS